MSENLSRRPARTVDSTSSLQNRVRSYGYEPNLAPRSRTNGAHMARSEASRHTPTVNVRQGVPDLKLIDLSHVIKSDMPQWPGDEQVLKIHRLSEHGPDNHMSSGLEIGCHIGTHLDGSLHFRAGEPGLHDLPLDDFAGSALVVNATVFGADADAPACIAVDVLAGHDLTMVDFVLFHTGWDRHWGNENYYRHWPWLSDELARVLASSHLKGVGLDVPSLDHKTGTIAHDLCAAAGMVNLENLTGLGPLADKKIQFMALPLKLYETEASPVRAVAWLPE